MSDRLPMPNGNLDPLDDVTYPHGPCIDCEEDTFVTIRGKQIYWDGTDFPKPKNQFACPYCLADDKYKTFRTARDA